MTVQRLPKVRTLWDLLPKGAEGGLEFARLAHLLVLKASDSMNEVPTLFDDSAGDFHGVDSYSMGETQRVGNTGYQYKFYPSPLSGKHRTEIEQSLEKAVAARKQSGIKRWVLVTPTDLLEPGASKSRGDVTWFNALAEQYRRVVRLEHIGHTRLLALFLDSPSLLLRYYPELVAKGSDLKVDIDRTREAYLRSILNKHRHIEFVGMSVYKEETGRRIPMEDIYIPLGLVPMNAPSAIGDEDEARSPASRLTRRGSNSVVLGDPGSGKSTLLRFLTLVGHSQPLQRRSGAGPDDRLPILVTLRRYADELKRDKNLSLLDFIAASTRGDYSLAAADERFFRYFLDSGDVIALFDGLDELPDLTLKELIRDRIRSLAIAFPGNACCVTSRIVGYDGPITFDESEFAHYRVGRLTAVDIRRFVEDWYCARIEDERERRQNVADLVRIVESPQNRAIRELAQNPLLLTIIALVHRIDAVLPDERVVLYQKCTETLLNTWNTWRLRELDVPGRGRIERKNRQRIESIAWWMHQRGGSPASERSIASLAELTTFLVDYIETREGLPAGDAENAADEFLRFVRIKAGLLVEVGPDAYGFLHQTFQEYLAASHLVSASERAGAGEIWNSINGHLGDARWQEVIRLAIAALRSDDTQEYLVERILQSDGDARAHSQLLAGLVLDNVEGARKFEPRIVERLLRDAAMSTDGSDVQSSVALLRALRARSPESEVLVREAFGKHPRISAEENSRYALVALAMREELASRRLDGGNAASIALSFLKPSEKGPTLSAEAKWLDELVPALALNSPGANLVAAMICCLRPDLVRTETLASLAAAFAGRFYGPFDHFTSNILLLSEPNEPVWTYVARQRLSPRQHSGVGLLVDDIYPRRVFSRDDLLVPLLGRTNVGSPDRNPLVRQDLDPVIQYAAGLPWGRRKKVLWQRLWALPGVESTTTRVLVEALQLTPGLQWHEALRASLASFIDKGQLPACVHNSAQQEKPTPDSRDEWSIARLVMIDAWLIAHGWTGAQKAPVLSAEELDGVPRVGVAALAVAIRNAFSAGDEAAILELRRSLTEPTKEVSSIMSILGLRSRRDRRPTDPAQLVK